MEGNGPLAADFLVLQNNVRSATAGTASVPHGRIDATEVLACP